jgi:hypothetical protein
MLAVIGMAASLLVPAGIAHAQVINGCVNAGGILRVIDPAKGESCRSSEKSLNWNQTGPQGIQGVAGTNGTNGINGVSGYEIVESNYLQSAGPFGQSAFFVDVQCPAGKRVLSAGGNALELAGNTIVANAIISGARILTVNGLETARMLVAKIDGAPFVPGEGVTGVAQAVCAIAL